MLRSRYLHRFEALQHLCPCCFKPCLLYTSPLAACYLVTFSEEYADQIEAAIERHVKRSTRAEITMTSLNDHGLITICPDRKAAIQAVNAIAPEHLELHVENAMDLLGSIKNAGAIFLGCLLYTSRCV